MALSTTYTQCAPETIKCVKITQNKGHLAVQGYSKSPIYGTNRKLIYDFLSLINTNFPPILHRVRDIAFEMYKNRYIWLPRLRLTPSPRRKGSPWTISVKFSVNVNG